MRRAVAAVVLAVLAAGCGGLPPAAVTPSASPAAVSVTAAPAPSGWTYLPWYDPDLELAVPSDWIPTTSFELWSPDPSTPADVASGAKWWNAKIASGAMRMQANSPSSGTSADQPTIALLVTVESGDPSLDAFVTRAVGEYSYAHEVGRHEAQFALGRCVVVDYATQLSQYAAVSRDFHFRLPDGRSLLVELSETVSADASPGPDAAALAQLADQIVATLRPHR